MSGDGGDLGDRPAGLEQARYSFMPEIVQAGVRDAGARGGAGEGERDRAAGERERPGVVARPGGDDRGGPAQKRDCLMVVVALAGMLAGADVRGPGVKVDVAPFEAGQLAGSQGGVDQDRHDFRRGCSGPGGGDAGQLGIGDPAGATAGSGDDALVLERAQGGGDAGGIAGGAVKIVSGSRDGAEGGEDRALALRRSGAGGGPGGEAGRGDAGEGRCSWLAVEGVEPIFAGGGPTQQRAHFGAVAGQEIGEGDHGYILY